GERIDPHRALDLVHAAGAGEPIGAVDVHRAASAHALAAGSSESQRRIDLVLDPDQRVEHHRPAILDVDEIGVDARVGAVLGIVAVDPGFPALAGPRRMRPGLALYGPRVLRQRDLDHLQYTRF